MSASVTDAAVLVILAISAFLAYSRGLTREALAIGGWIVAAFAAFFLAPFVEPLVREIPVAGEFLRSSCTLSVLAAFAIVFAAVLILLSIFTPIVSGLVLDSALGPLDRGLGFLFGVARGVVLVAVLYLLYDLLVPAEQRVAAVDGATSITLVREAADSLRAAAPAELPGWLGERIDRLVGACGAPVPPATGAAAVTTP
jgi:membrane protein required for colicin V production